MHKLVVRINGADAAFHPLFRNRSRQPKVCTSVSLFVFRERQRVHHTLLDIGPGVCEAIQVAEAFPQPFPLDWLILSHSHSDHFLGLDALCGDLTWWGRTHGQEAARLRVLALPSTFDETVGAHFPFQRSMLDPVAAAPGQPVVLWQDGQARLEVTLVEVRHFRDSAVCAFSFFGGEDAPARVVCLFDFGSFHPAGSPEAGRGSRADNPLFLKPDLLISEATNWTDQTRSAAHPDAHFAFLKLADHLRLWSPLQTRVVHYAGFEELRGEGVLQRYYHHLEQGLHLHPSEGPVAEWELNAAMQAHLRQIGYPRPLSVWAGRQGEALVVYPRVEEPG